MLRRNYDKHHQENSKLIFYAPLTDDKYPKYVAGGDYSLYYEGSGIISGGELYLSSNAANMGVGYNQPLPISDYTISAYHTRINTVGNQFSFMNSSHSNDTYWTLMLAHDKLITYVNQVGERMLSINSILPLNIKTFETVTTIKNDDGTYTTKIYINGVLKAENTMANTNLDNYISNYGQPYVGIGIWNKGSANGFVGKLSQLTCFQVLSDEEVMQQYIKKGVPEGF